VEPSKGLVLPGETRVLGVFFSDPAGLNISTSPPVSGALGVIGLSGRASRRSEKVTIPQRRGKEVIPAEE